MFWAKRRRTRRKRRSSRPVVEAVVVQCLSTQRTATAAAAATYHRESSGGSGEAKVNYYFAFPWRSGSRWQLSRNKRTNKKSTVPARSRCAFREKKKKVTTAAAAVLIDPRRSSSSRRRRRRRSLAWGKGMLKLTDRLSLLACPLAPFLHSPIHRFVGSSK